MSPPGPTPRSSLVRLYPHQSCLISPGLDWSHSKLRSGDQRWWVGIQPRDQSRRGCVSTQVPHSLTALLQH